ncbi:MAG: hypothetical protein R3D57_08295 [Hyphomicrobiaceae bacterium]
MRWFLIGDLCLVLLAAGAYFYVTGSEDRLDSTLKRLSEQVYAAVSGAIDGGYETETARLIAETAEPVMFRLAAVGGDTPVMAHRRGWINVQLSRSYDVIGDAERQLAFAVAGKNAFERARAQEPHNREWQRDLAAVEDDLGNAYTAAGDLDRALGHHREGRRLVEQLLREEPENTKLKGDLSASLGKLGRHYLGRGWVGQGTAYLRHGRRLIRELLVVEPGNERWQRYLRVFDRMIGEQTALMSETSPSRPPRL